MTKGGQLIGVKLHAVVGWEGVNKTTIPGEEPSDPHVSPLVYSPSPACVVPLYDKYVGAVTHRKTGVSETRDWGVSEAESLYPH